MAVRVTALLAQLEPELKALVDQVEKSSRLGQQVLYGKDFVSGRDCIDLRIAINAQLEEFLRKTMDPGRDSMRYASDGKGGFTR